MALELHGKPRNAARTEGYESPKEYADQGDTRKVRDLRFAYLAAVEDPAGNTVLEPVDVERNTVLNIEEIGLLALERGERLHSFYTSDELDRMASGGNPNPSTANETDPSTLGEYELAEYIKGDNPQGKALTVQEVVDLAGTDTEFAHRLLQAENIASDGDPRTGVEKGLTSVIEGGAQ
jgi:hypothetical protein